MFFLAFVVLWFSTSSALTLLLASGFVVLSVSICLFCRVNVNVFFICSDYGIWDTAVFLL